MPDTKEKPTEPESANQVEETFWNIFFQTCAGGRRKIIRRPAKSLEDNRPEKGQTKKQDKKQNHKKNIS